MNKVKKAITEGMLLEKSYRKLKKLFITDTLSGKNRRRVFKRIDAVFSSFFRRKLARETKVAHNKILFMTTRGSYNCNLRAIADEIIRQELPWELVWVVRREELKRSDQFPSKLRIVLRDSYELFCEMASAKVWLDNSINLQYLYMPKKKDQILIEAWHGSFGLKRFETSSDKIWIRKAKQAGARTDYCITNSEFENKLFKKTFWPSSEMLSFGYPRNDILVLPNTDKEKTIKKRLRSDLSIGKDVHVALYAPTYRDEISFSYYDIDYKKLQKALINRFGGEWIILVRFHFQLQKQVKKAKKATQFPEFVLDVSTYPDIQDLLLITDVGITDYSSWICDYMLTRRPAFFFVTDLRSFYSERGFYYPLETTPIPLAQNNFELINNIENFDEDRYRENCDKFLEEKGCFEDGHAAERVVEKLKELM